MVAICCKDDELRWAKLRQGGYVIWSQGGDRKVGPFVIESKAVGPIAGGALLGKLRGMCRPGVDRCPREAPVGTGVHLEQRSLAEGHDPAPFGARDRSIACPPSWEPAAQFWSRYGGRMDCLGRM